MKSRKLTYILISVTLITWGIVAYKLLFKVSDSDFAPRVDKRIIFNEDKDIDQSLHLDYPDPFLKGIKMKELDSSIRVKKSKMSSSREMPYIQYYGKIYKDKSEFYLVKEDSIIFTLRARSKTPKGVRILKGDIYTLHYEMGNNQYVTKIIN